VIAGKRFVCHLVYPHLPKESPAAFGAAAGLVRLLASFQKA
jgi:hypothetical protein